MSIGMRGLRVSTVPEQRRRLCLERGVGCAYLTLTNRHRDLARINAMSDLQSLPPDLPTRAAQRPRFRDAKPA